MRVAKLRIIEISIHGKKRWRISGYYPNGKRDRTVYQNRYKAELEIGKIKGIQLEEGKQGIDLSHEDRATITKYAPLLSKYGKTIAEACQYYLKDLKIETEGKDAKGGPIL